MASPLLLNDLADGPGIDRNFAKLLTGLLFCIPNCLIQHFIISHRKT